MKCRLCSNNFQLKKWLVPTKDGTVHAGCQAQDRRRFRSYNDLMQEIEIMIQNRAQVRDMVQFISKRCV